MKRFFRIVSVLTAALMLAVLMPLTASAGSFTEAKESIVFIVSEFTAPNSNTYIFQETDGDYYWLSSGSTVTFRGSGFAIGNDEEPVQYIVTNAHVVLDDTAAGIRSLDPLNANVNVSS